MMGAFDDFLSRAKAFFPYNIVLNSGRHNEVAEIFGKDGMPQWSSPAQGRWTVRPDAVGIGNDTYFFKNERDAVECKMRFG